MARVLRKAAWLLQIAIVTGHLVWPGGSGAQTSASADSNAAGVVTHRVSTAQQLQNVIRDLRGPSVIVLEPGNYDALVLRNMDVGPVELRSADPLRPAVFSSAVVRNAKGVTLRDLTFARYRPDTGAGLYLLSVMDSEQFEGDRLTFYSPQARVDPAIQTAVMLRNSKGIVFQRSSFTHFAHGLSFLDIENAQIRLNEFTDMQTDAIRGGGATNVLLEYNVATDFFPAEGDHPDGIQLWSSNQKAPSRHVTIRDNLVVKGRGEYVQGIFLRDELDTYPYEDVHIINNLMVGTMYNGITIDGSVNSSIVGNEVWTDPDHVSWIRVEMADNLLLEGNRAARYVILTNRGAVHNRNNKTGSRSYKNIGAGIREWVAERPTLVEHNGPVLRRLMED